MHLLHPERERYVHLPLVLALTKLILIVGPVHLLFSLSGIFL